MTEGICVRTEHLTKVYKKYKQPWYRVLNAFSSRIPYKEFYALKDISIEIPKGEAVGIVGKNGNGKSTLLKIITGVTSATSGTVETDGRIVAMLELTSGFDKELSGRENVYIKGRTVGMSREEVNARMQAIQDFADIGDFFDQPVRTYSSGMKSRLGFAVSINMDPDILIVDEVLAVGDISFKLKCLAKMEQFRKQGKTILFVSHDIATVKAFCTSCMWIKNGELQDYGETGLVVQKYQNYLKAERVAENKARRASNAELLLTKDDIIHPHNTVFTDYAGNESTVFEPGDDIYIRTGYDVKSPIFTLRASLTLFDCEDREIFGSDRQSDRLAVNTELGSHELVYKIKSPALLPGKYSVTCSLWNNEAGFARSICQKLPFEITSEYFFGTGTTAIELEIDN